MKQIFKYRLEITDEQYLPLPVGSDLLCVQVQKGKPCLWVVVDSEVEVMENVQIITHGTGHNCFGNIGQYLGTYQLMDGDFVGHCFKGIK